MELLNSISHAVVDVQRRTFPAGTLIWFRDNKTAFLALADGKLLPLADLLTGRLEREADLKAEITRLTQRNAELRDENSTLKRQNRKLTCPARNHSTNIRFTNTSSLSKARWVT